MTTMKQAFGYGSGKPREPKKRLILRPDRQYQKVDGKLRRVRQTPEPPVPCVVKHIPTNSLCRYAEDVKLLLHGDQRQSGHVFPSRTQAKKAIWHTVQNIGEPMGHLDYEIERV